jgi:hypothetical protein
MRLWQEKVGGYLASAISTDCEYKSYIIALVADEGLGLFCGLNAVLGVFEPI